MKEINKRFNKEINHKSKIFAGFIFVIRKILSLVFLRTISGILTTFLFIIKSNLFLDKELSAITNDIYQKLSLIIGSLQNILKKLT